jgi:hypothetical protein
MLKHIVLSVVEQWIDSFSQSDVRDLMLEELAVVGFLFLLVVVILAQYKSPILSSHGFIEMMVFIIFGLTSTVMDIIDEFIWFTQDFYNAWKLTKDLLLLLGAIVLVIGFLRFFQFSARLFGLPKEPEEREEENIL